MLILLAALAAPLPTQSPFDTDTTVSVQQGTRLKVQNQGGDIIIKAWDRNQLRVQASHSKRSEVSIEVHGAVAEITAHGRHGLSNLVDYEITVPTWMALDLGGMYAQVTIDGVKAPVKVQTLEGDITLRGGAESIALNTVNGRIFVAGARGRLDLHAVSDGIQVQGAQGDITAETVSGDVDLRGIDSRTVDVQSVSGSLTYEGSIADGGTYSLLTHSGEIRVGLPATANATISAATASGDVSSDLNLTAERKNRRRQTFRLGSGSATIDLETFSGDIELMRPADLPTIRDRDRDGDRNEPNRVKVKVRNKPPHDRDQDDDDDQEALR